MQAVLWNAHCVVVRRCIAQCTLRYKACTERLLAVKACVAAAQDTQGFPRVERDLLQVEQYSQELKAKAARIDPSGDALAATRLLAQEGLNTRK
jgi:hypothetical protein